MRSQELIPGELRRWLQPPRVTYVLTGIGLLLAASVCAVGIRKVADARLVRGTTQLTDAEQERVAQRLLAEGLSQFEFTDGVLMVPNGQRSEYLSVIREIRVGRRDQATIRQEVMNKMSPFLPREERLRRIQMAAGEEVAELLRAIDGVDEVYVHFDEAFIGGLRQQREVKASVFLRPTKGRAIDARLLSSVRRIVAGYKAGLVESNIVVSNIRTGDAIDGSVMPMTRVSQALAIEKATREQAWHDNISRVLRFIPGARVETNVELEPCVDTSEEHPACRESRVAIAVSVPAEYYLGLWAQNTGPDTSGSPSATEISALESQTKRKIESLVHGLNATGADAATINVAVFQELDPASTQLERINSPFIRWLKRHSNKFMQVSMVLLAIGLVFFAFRDLFYEDEEDDSERHGPGSKDLRVAPETSTGSAAKVDIRSSVLAREENLGGRDFRHRELPTSEIVDASVESNSPGAQEDKFVHAELTDLVRQNPQAASAMLKSWVEKAG